jgi:reactive chlorine resistance protein C
MTESYKKLAMPVPTTTPALTAQPLAAPSLLAPASLERLPRIGLGVLRYGLVFLLMLWGGFKFAALEAEAIRPLVEHSPLLSWLYVLVSVPRASALLGSMEILLGLVMATRRWWPRASGLASLGAAGIFAVTLSFLVTTPGVLAPTSETGGFLMKDLILLGAALVTASEALLAASRPRSS